MSDTETPVNDATETIPPESPPQLHGWPLTMSHDQQVVHCVRDGYFDLMAALREDGFEVCADLCAADYLAHVDRDIPGEITAERFEV
ncbi:MAG TPA: hypothetical protein VLL25_08690, partial [Acidimicrobiales bacterium]|nr:hypothetical protein [Acidimicrobiales bacterium]